MLLSIFRNHPLSLFSTSLSQEFTYAIRAQGRLVTAEEFGRIVLRANPDGSLVRLKDVARLDLGAQDYNNALTLSPALCSILLRPKKETRGPLGWFYRLFNRTFRRGTETYISISRTVIRKAVIGFVILVVMTIGIGLLGKQIPGGFLPEEDQGYLYAVVQLPNAASLQRTSEVGRQVERIIMNTPGVEYCTTVIGFNLLSYVRNTYSGFFFVRLKDWSYSRYSRDRLRILDRHQDRNSPKINLGCR